MADWEGSKHQMDFALAALRSSILMNGGAAIALLAFIGNVFGTKDFEQIKSHLACSLIWFILGVFFSALAFGFGYVSNVFAFEKPFPKLAGKFRWATLGSFLISLLAFLYGGYLAYRVLG